MTYPDIIKLQAVAHSRDPVQTASLLNVSTARGLSSEEVERRQNFYGPNALQRRKSVSLLKLLWNQLAGPIVALLAIAAMIAFAVGEWKEGIAIAAVLVINSVIGFTTELRAVRSMEALRALGESRARVRRNGHIHEISAVGLVPGDILLLEGGDVIPADIQLVSASNLLIDESALTGESVAVDKSVALVTLETPVADRACIAFKGTAAVRGSATGVVIGTGMNTELGKISKLVFEAEPERSPLERQLDRLGGQLIWVTLLMAALIAGVGIATGRDIFLMVEAAVALAVAAIPEGLPIVATLALARGMWRMAKRNALVERLSAVETLGATTIICADKTGTLTENKMQLKRLAVGAFDIEFTQDGKPFRVDGAEISIDENELVREVLTTGALCNNAALETGEGASSGDPLEIALLIAADAVGLNKDDLLSENPQLREFAFDTDVNMMATAHQAKDGVVYFIKGAPEAVLAHSFLVRAKGAAEKLSPEHREQWLERTNALAAQGLRVLAFARKSAASADDPPYEQLEFLGLGGLYDPPRQDVKSAIAACKRAGIRVVMITGDHAVTAKNIAVSIGIAEKNIDVVEGKSLKPFAHQTQSDREAIQDAEVFARVTPAQKLDLITVYQTAGEVVAMTGDGVNDAPALKKADIGVAMGQRGTQVAREAAAVVLRDDAFSTIIEAVREGRVIFKNIQRFVTYLLSCNLSEVLVVGLAILAGLPLPLLPLQILFLNLVTDVFPAFALGAGAGDAGVLDRKPRDPKKPILPRGLWIFIVGNGLAITAATLGSLYLAIVQLDLAADAAVTVSFLTIAFAQLLNVFNMRDPRTPIFNNDIVTNPYIWAALAICTSLLLSVLYIPSIASVLHLVPPNMNSWIVIMTMSALPLLIGQIGKEVSRQLALRHRSAVAV